MKLWIVMGGAEYLLRGLTPQLMLPILRELDPDAHLPSARWLNAEDSASLHQELFKSDSDDVIRLFLESVAESYQADDNVYIPLCFESSLLLSADPPTLSDSRSERFLSLAVERFGPSSLVCARFYLSQRTEAILQLLHARLTEAGLAGYLQRDARVLELPVFDVELESRALPGSVEQSLWSNYQESVLRRMGMLLGRKLPFDPVSFGNVFARRSHKAGLVLRRDIEPADVAESLDGDKMLWALGLL